MLHTSTGSLAPMVAKRKSCTNCLETKTLKEFYHKRSFCKECIRLLNSIRDKMRYDNDKHSTVDKRCSNCHLLKPAALFPASKNQCKNCINTKRLERCATKVKKRKRKCPLNDKECHICLVVKPASSFSHHKKPCNSCIQRKDRECPVCLVVKPTSSFPLHKRPCKSCVYHKRKLRRHETGDYLTSTQLHDLNNEHDISDNCNLEDIVSEFGDELFSTGAKLPDQHNALPLSKLLREVFNDTPP